MNDSLDHTADLVSLLLDKGFARLGQTTYELISTGPMHVRAVLPSSLLEDFDVQRNTRSALFDLVELLLSESTNNDSCRTTVTETSAHFADHDLNYTNLPFGSVVVYDARCEDYLS
jgi:hypothetical protein